MRLEVSGLPALPTGQSYTLWLTKDGKLAESCGSFVVGDGTTKVPLNAPYKLKQFDVLGDRADRHDEPVAAQRHDLSRARGSSGPRAIVEGRDRFCSPPARSAPSTRTSRATS